MLPKRKSIRVIRAFAVNHETDGMISGH